MPSYTYQPLSELEAVNIMLGTIGESPVSSLNTSGDLHVSVATQMLYDVSREVQTVGYQFNSETDYPLIRDLSNNIPYPSNALSLDVTNDYSSKYDTVMRGGKLYDRKAHTYVFPEDIKVEIVLFLTWAELPQPARQYITIQAARRFQRRFQGDAQIDRDTAAEEALAKAQLEDFDASTRDYNLADNSDVFQIIGR